MYHIYLFSILVDRAGVAAVPLLVKEIPLRLLVEKKLMSRSIPKVVKIKILTTLSHIMGPVQLNGMLQYKHLILQFLYFVDGCMHFRFISGFT